MLDLGRLLLGLTVIALGVLFLLDAAGTLDAGAAIDDRWPALIVAAGVLTLAERPPAIVRGDPDRSGRPAAALHHGPGRR